MKLFHNLPLFLCISCPVLVLWNGFRGKNYSPIIVRLYSICIHLNIIPSEKCCICVESQVKPIIGMLRLVTNIYVNWIWSFLLLWHLVSSWIQLTRMHNLSTTSLNFDDYLEGRAKLTRDTKGPQVFINFIFMTADNEPSFRRWWSINKAP